MAEMVSSRQLKANQRNWLAACLGTMDSIIGWRGGTPATVVDDAVNLARKRGRYKGRTRDIPVMALYEALQHLNHCQAETPFEGEPYKRPSRAKR